MQASLNGRAGWLWCLAAAVVGVAIAMGWQVRAGRTVATVAAPAPIPVVANAVRVPVPSRTPAPPAQAAPTPALTLVGTVLAGAGSFATVRTSDSRLLQLRVGDRVDGLTVSAIESDRVLLAGAAQPVVIEADPSAAAAQPPVLPRAVSAPPAVPVEQPVWAEGQAPWDLAPPFKH